MNLQIEISIADSSTKEAIRNYVNFKGTTGGHTESIQDE
jgi:hypothetical protein